MAVNFKNKQLWLFYDLSLVVIALDQLAKWWADTALQRESLVLTPFFKFELAYNQGAAFSFLQTASGWQRWVFSGIALVISTLIVVWMAAATTRPKHERRWELLALSLVLGGALGNLVDRLRLGYVVDFVVLHYQHYAWPTFNVADSAICVGAAVLLLDLTFLQRKRQAADFNKADSHV